MNKFIYINLKVLIYIMKNLEVWMWDILLLDNRNKIWFFILGRKGIIRKCLVNESLK